MVDSLLTQCTRNWHTPGRQNCSQGEGRNQLKPLFVCECRGGPLYVCVFTKERKQVAVSVFVWEGGHVTVPERERKKTSVDRRGRIPVEALLCHGRLVKTWKEGKQQVKRRESRESDQLPAWRRMRMRCWVFWTKFWRMKICMTMRWTWTVHSLQWNSGRLRWERERQAERWRDRQHFSLPLLACWQRFCSVSMAKNSEVESIKPFFATWR